jgi:DNA-binding transcriptional LysR family regulator
MLRPYASPSLVAQGVSLPGSVEKPVPLLMYSVGVYFARLVDLIFETAGERVVGARILENDMSDVLRDMALAGHGVAWIPDSTALHGNGQLVPLGGDMWTLPLKIVAFKDRANRRRSVSRVWAQLAGQNSRKGGRESPSDPDASISSTTSGEP